MPPTAASTPSPRAAAENRSTVSTMTKPAQAAARIERLMESASRALVETRYFECEAECLEALELAHGVGDYERMARILMPLQEARRQVRLLAVDTGRLVILNEPVPEGAGLEAGCYLIEPPLVGADARDLRDRAARQHVAVMVLAREPAVKTLKLDRRPGDWPVVMIGPVTVRAYVKPPAGGKVTLEWFQAAGEALGDRAIAEVDAGLDVFARVEDLFERLHCVTDHEKLHQALESACREAAVTPRPAVRGKAAASEEEDEFEDAA